MGSDDAERLPARYAWADSDEPAIEALSITLVRPGDGSALVALSPRRELTTALTFDEGLEEAFALDDYGSGSVLAQIDQLDAWDVIVEPCGWAGSIPDTLALLSRHEIAINVFWNVNGDVTFTVAQEGVITRTFDALRYEPSALARPEEADLRWGVGAPRASALALMERLSGVAVGRGWLLGRARRSFVIPA